MTLRNAITRILCVTMLILLTPGAYADDARAITPATEEHQKSGVPTVFFQHDERWADQIYYYTDLERGSTISDSGCGLLALVNAVYYLNGCFIDPVALAEYSAVHGYHTAEGTSKDLYEAFAADHGKELGFAYDGEAYSYGELRDKLRGGCVSICSVPGHIMAIVDYDEKTDRYLLMDSSPHWKRGTGNACGYKTIAELDEIPSLVTDDVGVTPPFVVFRAVGTLHVGCQLAMGDSMENEEATFDVWINGEKVADDVQRFDGNVDIGARYLIDDIHSAAGRWLALPAESALFGEITVGATRICLRFTLDAP